ncbi:hypothetical protein CGW93_01640 [candidate division bacterium WOR-3 4484_18]|uniref:DUF6754 domain-containing protein n=1 Tax=candidate division WOR-3 bacterium 4484_18 TaxID=2020626 RepID=A0A257LUE8_UNCW3|nr:MAG: hypothetical protein CGW93_01640 [candidate division bacterium WOR-3 4484_18]
MLIAILLLVVSQAGGQDTLAPFAPPTNIIAKDAPWDAGNKVIITWRPSIDKDSLAYYEIWRATPPFTKYERIGIIGSTDSLYEDHAILEDTVVIHEVTPGKQYRYKLRGVTPDGRFTILSEPSNIAIPRIQAFNIYRLNVLIAFILFTALFLYSIERSKRGFKFFIRRIPGLDALDEAVGRATEMGKPVLYSSGLNPIDSISTIASMCILGEVARKIARYESRLIVPNIDPIVMTVAQEVVKEAYLSEGKPHLYREDDVFFLAAQQFPYAAGISGIMVRERPATNLFIGYFYAESLILAEAGNMSGAIQVAATDAIMQLPFFVAACDYTIIGEELYAASAYLSGRPDLVATIKTEDWFKMILLILTYLGSIIVLLTKSNLFLTIFKVTGGS